MSYIDKTREMLGEYYDPQHESVEKLRSILKHHQNADLSYDETEKFAFDLVVFFQALAGDSSDEFWQVIRGK